MPENRLEDIRKFMERHGIPGRDLYDLPVSEKRFPDGAHYRMEIAGIERVSTLRAMVDESKKRNLPVHRVIATVGGSTYCDFEELKEMASIAHGEGIEVIMTVGHRKAWDPGAKEISTSEGAMQGFRFRGSDQMSYWIADMMRCIDAGFRGFLVYDEGVLNLVDRMRKEDIIPRETLFKFSVFGGCCSPAGAKVIEALGADTMNPSSDVALPIIAGIRRAVPLPLDIYISIVDSFGGMFRAYEAPEIARIAAPCYFKFEPGTSEAAIYKPWVTEAWHAEFVRQKVKMAAIVREIVQDHAPELILSEAGAADLTQTVLS